MIKINLLPPEARRAATPALVSALPLKQIGIGALGILLLYTVWITIQDRVQRGALGRLTAEWQELQPQRLELEKVQASLTALRNRAQVLQALKAPEAKWAPRLNLFSDSLVSKLWFSSLRYGFAGSEGQGQTSPGGSPSALELRGFALVTVEEGDRAPVSRFLGRVKSHPEFANLFESVELTDLRHREIGEEEVSEFILIFQPAGT